MTKKYKNYIVMTKITLDTDLEISAESLEDALTKSKEFDIHSFVDMHGNYNDGSCRITGVFETG